MRSISLPVAVALLCGCAAETSAPEPSRSSGVEVDIPTVSQPGVQKPIEGLTDTYRDDIPDGLPPFLQGMWTLKGSGDGLPFHVFEGNRVSLFYRENGKRIEAGSDNFRPVDNCRDLDYDPMGRGVQLGAGLFEGDELPCWSIRAIRVDEIDIQVEFEKLTFVRVQPEPRMKLGTTPTLDGRWVSKNDPNASLDILGRRLTESHGGDQMERELIRFVDSCVRRLPVADGAKHRGAFLRGEGDEAQCFTILRLTATEMDLSLAGRGNLLTYRRAP